MKINLKIKNLDNRFLNKYFLVSLIIYGLIYITITPPLYLTDEYFHFQKAASKQNFYINKKLSISEDLDKFINQEKYSWYFLSEEKNYKYIDNFRTDFKQNFSWDNENLVSAKLGNLKGYPVSGYIFSKIGVNLSKIFTNNIFISYYFGKIFNFLLLVFLVFYLIEKIKKNQYLYYIILSLPMTLSLMSSYNQDSMLIFYTVTIIYIFSILLDLNKFDKKKLFFLVIFIFLLSLGRPIYISFILLPFVFINFEKIFSKKNYFIISTVFLTVFLFCLFIYTYPAPNKIDGQLNYIINNPFYFLKVIYNDIKLHTFTYYVQFIGVLGHINIQLHKLIYIFVTLVFILISIFIFLSLKKIKISKLILIVTISIISSYILLCISQYLYFTSFKNIFIQGIAGRYFIPIALISFLIFPKIKQKYNNDNLFKFVLLFFPHINFFSIISAYNFFY